MPPFPDVQRIRYQHNPLYEVVCQIRFSDILRISSETPSPFQERIRDRLPDYEELRAPQFPQGIPDKVRQSLIAQGVLQAKPVHVFRTTDSRVQVRLAQGFIAVTDSQYTSWEEFRSYLDLALEALGEIYRPGPFGRVGLRYQNAIRRSLLGLDGVEWRDLLMPAIAGELTDLRIVGAIEGLLNVIDVRLPHGKVRLQHGRGEADDVSKEEIYVIDADFHSEGGDRPELPDLLDEFHGESGRLFRWCINERLHGAMGPRPI